jgi:hypothetical protein
MAAVSRAGNTVYVTAAGQVYTANNGTIVRVQRIVISPAAHGSGTPSITLTDQSQSPNTKISLCAPNTTAIAYPFEDCPLEFYGGFSVSALSGAVATIIVQG